ncbi:hypothetical protein M8J76_002610 [Diaphorina citri]|nr:hypothetical protein M8J76_002610 [Diaphorina citri]KAI5747477.1 hypothetical protein M8J77_015071 [Diaphorina citri]
MSIRRIAGWKQKDHPMLYNALHIGDQVLKIMGQFVQNATDAQKLIRSKHGIYVEFVILRVPRGRVYAMCREQQGQSLGIIQEGTAEIKDIVPNSIAHQNGITLRCPTMDGLGLSTWWITEINGRPLNLFFKDNEVRDRLNCVGLDISLLIQPFDLIKQIKKQMKSSIRGYKDYIVQ